MNMLTLPGSMDALFALTRPLTVLAVAAAAVAVVVALEAATVAEAAVATVAAVVSSHLLTYPSSG